MIREMRVKTSHAEIAVADSGLDGIPLLMLHGNSLSKATFRPQFEALGERFRLIALDLPGHGASADAADPQRSYTMGGYADCVVEVLHGLDVPRIVVLGHSLGGFVALELIPRFGGLAGIVLSGAPPIAKAAGGFERGFRPIKELALSGKADLTAIERVEFAIVMGGVQASDDPVWLGAIRRTDGLARQCMIEALLAGRDHDYAELALSASVPLAVIDAAGDPAVNLDYVAAFPYANLWRGTTHTLPGTSHCPHWENPAAFNALLADFLQETAA